MRISDETKPLHGGTQRMVCFDNGYSASIVRHSFSYGDDKGLYELAVIHSGGLVYDTPITDDVIGNLTKSKLDELLEKIDALPKRETAKATDT